MLNPSSSLILESPGDGALHATWTGASTARLEMGADIPSDVSREANGAMMVALTVRISAAPAAGVRLGVGSASVPVTARLRAFPIDTYATLAVPLSCFSAQDLSKTPTIVHLPDGSQKGSDVSCGVRDRKRMVHCAGSLLLDFFLYNSDIVCFYPSH